MNIPDIQNAQDDNKEWGIINCHTHIATINYLNKSLFVWPFPISAVSLLGNPFLRKILLFLVGKIISPALAMMGYKSLEESWERLASLAKMSTLQDEQKIKKEALQKKAVEENTILQDEYQIKSGQGHVFDILRSYYPEGTKFVILSLDTEYMFSEKKRKKVDENNSFEKQLKDLVEIKNGTRYKGEQTAFPFIHADPRRPGIVEMVNRGIENSDYHGIKIYPPFGYLPNGDHPDAYKDKDKKFPEDLREIYRVAEEKGTPIVAHCTPTGILGDPYYNKYHGIFTDPDNYQILLDEFPKLNLCLAHFGGNTAWSKYLEEPWEPSEEEDKNNKKAWGMKITDMIEAQDEDGKLKYPNLYTDISYTSFDLHTLALLKVHLSSEKYKALSHKILFGSDFPVLQADITERAFSINLRGYLGETLFEQIASKNPRRFLRL
ncbi:MAG: amidohydrolase family protein [Chloroflexi bacterium]|nr:amidohydrolase family protein [Chloroflexota bacterium]